MPNARPLASPPARLRLPSRCSLRLACQEATTGRFPSEGLKRIKPHWGALTPEWASDSYGLSGIKPDSAGLNGMTPDCAGLSGIKPD
eukprot:999558-Pyramimonas_sp.AAC.1